MKIRHRYIAFEGTPLSGKTTHAKNLYQFLRKLDYEASYYKFAPSNSKFGEFLLSLRDYNLPDLFIDNLYLIDMVINDIKIRRDLKKGKIVISDKHLPSLNSFINTYRDGINRRILNREIEFLEKILLEPDILFYLFCDYDEKLSRVENKKDVSHYDISLLSSKKILKKLEREMEMIIKRYKNVIKINTTNRSIEEIDKFIWKTVLEEENGEKYE